MVAPVADVAPRVVRFLDLPVDAFLGDTVRVVAVDSRGVHEFSDHVLDEFGKAERKRFPVLENVAPVSLIRQQVFAVLILEADLELIPGPTWVAVAATEPDRQVLASESLQLSVAAFVCSR